MNWKFSFRSEILVVILIISTIVMISEADKSNKYSKKANQAEADEIYSDFRNLKQPFRVAKLNLIWSKAAHRLTEPKLKSLFTELKIHDKEELGFKHQKSEKPKDFQDGTKEADMRKKLIGIMSTYDLLEVIDINEAEKPENQKKHKAYEGKVKNENYINKGLFKDKKLNKLWERAETGGFSPEELAALKEEFTHHEEKIQLYYSMLEKLTNVKDNADKEKHLNAVDEEDHDSYNEIFAPNEQTNEVKQIEKPEEKHRKYEAKVNEVRDKHREIRDNTDRLERKVSEKSEGSDFIEPKVQGLWKIAQAGNFSADELASIKVELHHFEARFLKLRTMHAEHALARERNKDLKPGDKHHDRLDELEGKIKKHSRKVEKLQEDLEKRLQQHNEL